MNRTIEIKAKLPTKFEHEMLFEHKFSIYSKLKELCGNSGICLKQHDTHFNCNIGRLKLREYRQKIGNGNERPKPSELIFYERTDEEIPALVDCVRNRLPAGAFAQLTEVLDRSYGEGSGEKQRTAEGGPTLSDCVKVDLPRGEGQRMKESLTRAYGVKGIVENQRTMFIYQRPVKYRQELFTLRGQTRVHYDQVEGLGNFIEFKICLSEDQSLEDGESIANKLKAELGIRDEDLLRGSYLDLMQEREGNN